MNSAINEVHKAFDKAGLKHDVQQLGTKSVLITGMTGKADSYKFFLIKDDDSGSDIALRIIKIINCPSYLHDQAREVLNSLQIKYRFLRFTIDKDGDINGEYDFPTTYDDIGSGAVEMCLRLTLILDDCLPELKRLVR
ncbi:MAG: hypothetical protein IKW50_04580 [Oscillospiraceae bacterium]|nr:hypothetical protein [Oscillospiraceae bacterium]